MGKAKRGALGLMLLAGIAGAGAKDGPENRGLSPVIHESAQDCRLRMVERGREGFADCEGKTVIKAKFGYVKEFSEGRAIALVYASIAAPANFYLLDTTGGVRAKLPLTTYSEVRPFRGGRAIVARGNLFGVIDPDGNQIVPPKYEFIRDYSEGRAAFLADGRVGYLDESGNEIISAQFDPMRFHPSPHGTQFHHGMYDFSEGLAAAGERGKRGYIDIAGKVAIPFQYEGARRFANGLAAVRINGKTGFIDRRGNIQVQPQFDVVGDFNEDYAVVGINGKYGFIDARGNQLTDRSFDKACSFKGGMACVEQNGRYGLINAHGKIVVSPTYDVIFSFHGDLAFATRDGLTHLLHRSGQVLATTTLMRYDSTFMGKGRLTRVEVCKGMAYLDDHLNVIWPNNLGDRCSQAEEQNYCEDASLTAFDREVVCSSSRRLN